MAHPRNRQGENVLTYQSEKPLTFGFKAARIFPDPKAPAMAPAFLFKDAQQGAMRGLEDIPPCPPQKTALYAYCTGISRKR